MRAETTRLATESQRQRWRNKDTPRKPRPAFKPPYHAAESTRSQCRRGCLNLNSRNMTRGKRAKTRGTYLSYERVSQPMQNTRDGVRTLGGHSVNFGSRGRIDELLETKDSRCKCCGQTPSNRQVTTLIKQLLVIFERKSDTFREVLTSAFGYSNQ